MMTASFGRNFTVVTITHFIVVIALVIVPGVRQLFQKDRVMEAEFTVAIPPDMIDTRAQEEEAKDDTPAAFIEDDSDRGDKKKQDKKKLDTKKDDPKAAKKLDPKKDIKQKGNKIRINTPVPPSVNPNNRLTADQIRDLLDKGARPGAETIIPDDVETLSRAVIRNKFYDAWIQPSYEEVGAAVAVAELSFAQDGTIMGAVLSSRSGNSTLDTSVLDAVKYIRRIDGLSAAYLRENPKVKISFTVTADGGTF